MFVRKSAKPDFVDMRLQVYSDDNPKNSRKKRKHTANGIEADIISLCLYNVPIPKEKEKSQKRKRRDLI